MHAFSTVWAAVPLWILAIASLMGGGLFLVYWNGYWARLARIFLRTTWAGTIYWVLSALLLNSHSAIQAENWERFMLPAEFLFAVGLIEYALELVGARPPRWLLPTLWSLGIAALLGSLSPHTLSWYVLTRVPNGFWIGHRLQPWWLSLLRTVVIIGSSGTILGILIWGYARRSRRRLGAYLVGLLVFLPLKFNDAVYVQNHRTWFPTFWIGGLFLLMTMWWELRREVYRTYQGLNTDALTHAMSRSFGEQYATERLRDQALAVLFVDIDHFKAINDTYGHATGDAVLQELVSRISRVLVPGDQLVRIGGDEFLILLPNRRDQQATAIIQRVMQAISLQPVSLTKSGGPDTFWLSVSMGWARGTPGQSFEAIVSAADRAMYRERAVRRASE
jgi:diguanylate cyclase (GGDEF)-like protein